MKPKNPQHRMVTYCFERMEPGEVATVGSIWMKALRPLSVTISARDFGQGAAFDSLTVDGQVLVEGVGDCRSTKLVVPVVEGGREVQLHLRNEGQAAIWPTAAIDFEVVEA
jgi:hypothetical protein